jgi:hypothetical protein
MATTADILAELCRWAAGGAAPSAAQQEALARALFRHGAVSLTAGEWPVPQLFALLECAPRGSVIHCLDLRSLVLTGYVVERIRRICQCMFVCTVIVAPEPPRTAPVIHVPFKTAAMGVPAAVLEEMLNANARRTWRPCDFCRTDAPLRAQIRAVLFCGRAQRSTPTAEVLRETPLHLLYFVLSFIAETPRTAVLE